MVVVPSPHLWIVSFLPDLSWGRVLLPHFFLCVNWRWYGMGSLGAGGDTMPPLHAAVSEWAPVP